MSERPIIFSAPMVRAILDGRKTMTRRIIKPQPDSGPDGRMVDLGGGTWGLSDGDLSGEWRLWNIGDMLWVREQFATDGPRVLYAATDDIHELRKKKPSIHMPRWASRITLRVTGVKVERLQDISEDDAKAEGAPACVTDGEGKFYAFDEPNRGTHRCGFAGLWASIHGPGAWDANPFVAAISFERING